MIITLHDLTKHTFIITPNNYSHEVPSHTTTKSRTEKSAESPETVRTNPIMSKFTLPDGSCPSADP